MTTPTILVPIDFSDCAIDVVRTAAREASAGGKSVVLLHVVHTPEGLAPSATVQPDGSAPVSAESLLRKEAHELMGTYVDEVAQRGVPVSYRVADGPPAETILAIAGQLDPELIVMGTHARTGFARLVLGSVASKVQKHASCRVLTVRTQHKQQCKARSCSWCDTDRTARERELIAELDG